jgi:homoserine dehydrogenase
MKPIHIGLLGIGTVGGGTYTVLKRNQEEITRRAGREIVVKMIADKDLDKARNLADSGVIVTADAHEITKNPDIDIVVELIGGQTIAKDLILEAIANGKHVVTANKALLASHGTELARLAEASNVALNFEAAVAGGIPIVKTMRESLAGNQVTRVFGILNGTCNYILTRMRNEGQSFEAVLVDAQRAGYAEADATFDVDGHDTAHKLAILTSLAFGTEISFETIYLEGIRSITPADIEAADELGYKIKLLGVALRTDSGVEQRVHPTMVPSESAIAQVDGVLNCVALTGDYSGDIMLVGPGAGAEPTASSVVSDIADIARGLTFPAFVAPASRLVPHLRAAMRAHEGGYYIRLSVYDRPGAFAAIASRMATEGISLESIVQKRRAALPPGSGRVSRPGEPTPIVIITHETTEAAIRRALEAIETDGHVNETPQMIRIERL